MSKHTPGPWLIEADMCHAGDIATVYNTADSWVTIYAPHWMESGLDKQKQSANARLIAAAPDLLAICQELQQSADYWSEYDVPLGIVERINAAIAKATGEAA